MDQNGVSGPMWTKWSTVDPTGTNTSSRNNQDTIWNMHELKDSNFEA